MNSPQFKPHLPLIHDYLVKWAVQTPEKEALIQHEDGRTVSYKEFNNLVDLWALGLIRLGMNKGDRLAVMGLQSIEFLTLQYACMKIGVIICPLDIKLKPQEAVKELTQIRPLMFVTLGISRLRDVQEIEKAIEQDCSFIQEIWEYDLCSRKARRKVRNDKQISFDLIDLQKLAQDESLLKLREQMFNNIKESDPALIIFTTGTTGGPKPALIQHKCIVAQMEIISRAGAMPREQIRRVCTLPCSHVGGTTITVYSTIYGGGTNILLQRFHPSATLEAIEKWRGNWLGAVPTMYRMIWSFPRYEEYDLSSLKCAYYAGSMVDQNFLEQLALMAPNFGTSLGMTECGGVSTYTPMPVTVDEMLGQVGTAAEDVARISIRKPMNSKGQAGEELKEGECGEICYHEPLVFLGYYNQPEATAKTVSKENILYSGDIGYFKQIGNYKALFFKGRSKFMIKQKGYNVFPDEVAAHITFFPGVAEAEVIGVKHSLYDEGVFAFVITKPGEKVYAQEIMEHCKKLTAYKRPQYVKIMENSKGFPLNNNGKVDKNALKEIADGIINELRNQGEWDTQGC